MSLRDRAGAPPTRILFIATAPNPARWKLADQMRQLNQLVQAYAMKTPWVTYVDVFTPMLGPDGAPRPELFVADKLHMNAQGYALWTEILRPLIQVRE